MESDRAIASQSIAAEMGACPILAPVATKRTINAVKRPPAELCPALGFACRGRPGAFEIYQPQLTRLPVQPRDCAQAVFCGTLV